jgi:7,8-dihydropterin-6-yl-methyl-4-(beta-D-ribofuranosyl)aminobenzene 5'-phosphate synthase
LQERSFVVAGGLSITVLVENTVNRRGLLAEHGLAFWLERGGRRILFDTGQGMALAHNADKLGIDLSSANDVVLSHGHYDHTGGLLAALPEFKAAAVYADHEAFCDRFVRDSQTGVRSVRSPIESFEWLTRRVARVVRTDRGPVDLGDGIRLTGRIPRQNAFEDAGGAFYLDSACTRPDAVMDDQALYAETGSGVAVLLGCAHAGVVNTLDFICAATGKSRIFAVIGGMHLLNANEFRMEQTIRKLRDLDVQRVGLAHCTGFAAMARLNHELPNRCFSCVAGTRIEFEADLEESSRCHPKTKCR